MANHANTPIRDYPDYKLLAITQATCDWLSDADNLAKCGMPKEAYDEIVALRDRFTVNVATQNSAYRTVLTTLDKDATRAEIQAWYSDNFYRFIYDNKHLEESDYVACGYHAHPDRRRHVPPPDNVTCLLTIRTKHDGVIFVTAMGTSDTIGKPADVDGIELEYYTEDPRLNHSAKATLLGQYTSIKEEIRIKFTPDFYEKTLYIRGRWYNHNGKSEWSSLIGVLIQGEQ